MSETTSPETASSDTLSGRADLIVIRHVWRKLIAGLPILCVVLLVLVLYAIPGDSFLQGEATGIYWLFCYGERAAWILFVAVIATTLLGVGLPFRASLRHELLDIGDRLLMTIDAILLSVAIFIASCLAIWMFFMAVFGSSPGPTHLDTQYTGEHAYHLAQYVCWGDIRLDPAPSPRVDQYDSYYLIFECDGIGFICHRIYPLGGVNLGSISSMNTVVKKELVKRLEGSLEYDPTTGELQLIEDDVAIVTRQVAP